QVRVLYLTPDAEAEGINMRPTGTLEQAVSDAATGLPPEMMTALGEMMAAMTAYQGDEKAMEAELTEATAAVLKDNDDLTQRLGQAMEIEGEITAEAIVAKLNEESESAADSEFDPAEFTPEKIAPLVELFEAIQASASTPDRAK